MSKFKTIDVWNRVYGAEQEAYDYAGRLMKKSACGNPNSSYHPTLDHIFDHSWSWCDSFGCFCFGMLCSRKTK